jgi:ATP-dependent metalloprotease
MLDQDPKSPLLGSEPAFQLYLTCLINTNQQASVDAAVRRRDSLLAASGLTSVVNPQPAEDVPASPTTTTNSQQIAEKVLFAQAKQEPPLAGNPLATGTAANPVLVTIVERESLPSFHVHF